MSDSKFSIDGLQELLDRYAGYEVGESTPPTLMEIAGFPHRENVYSNILAFFLDTEQDHGFGPLFVQSILAAYQAKCPNGWDGKDLEPDNVSETDKVEREVATEKGRIDILIECPEFVVCTENKIWSGLQNDLCEYRRHHEHHEKSAEKRPVLGIVLSPFELGAAEKQKMNQAKFVNVTYADLVRELQHRLGCCIGWRNTQYQYLLFDFIEQADQFGRRKIMTEDQNQFLNFWRENETKIESIQSMCDDLRKALRASDKAQAHIDQCLEELKKNNPSYVVVFRSWICRSHIAVFDLSEKVNIDGCGVFLDVEFHPHKVSHVLGKRRGVKPTALASRVSKMCSVDFQPYEWAGKQDADKLVFHHMGSPFEDHILKAAVENSVKILKALADLKLESGDDAALK